MDDLRNGNRRALSHAITLVESTRTDHRERACKLLEGLRRAGVKQALRIALTGPPGVGKSTFIEGFGQFLTDHGITIAVLAIDPASVGGGSILGDKTRMPSLSQDRLAFVRPSPARTEIGGIERRTHESVFLCEQAGFDVVLVESTGVGQSQTTAVKLTDLFILMLNPASGDELQGIKRGIMEYADIVVVNKADGDLEAAAKRTCADYASALRLLRPRRTDPTGFPKVIAASANRARGFSTLWNDMSELSRWRKENGYWNQNRREQNLFWFTTEVQMAAAQQFRDDPQIAELMKRMEQCIMEDEITGSAAASEVIAAYVEHLNACS